jgi:CubicO group peptidase (beta-lactamase class C family)
MTPFLCRLLAVTVLIGFGLALAMSARRSQAMAQAAAPDLAAIDAYIEEEMGRARIPGLALTIVRGEELLHVRGYGAADPAGTPVSPQTPFLIGSNSKSFTALAVMQLVESGRLELDAPVQRYLPWFAVADPVAAARITVRHLLYHTSGIPTVAGQAFAADDDTSDQALERHVRGLSSVALTEQVGQRYQYSNANYNVLGLLVQVVSGLSYEAYVQRHIFEPLEMRNSFTAEVAGSQQGLATGHQRWFGFPRPAPTIFNRGDLPAGFLIASAEDLGHYLIAHLNGGRYGESVLLSGQGMATLHEPGSEIAPDSFYAMGWGVTSIEGFRTILHSGSNDNFRSHLVLLPAQQLGFAIMMNVNDAIRSERLDGLRTGVAYLLAGRQPPPVAPNWPGWLITWLLPALLLGEAVALWRAVAHWRSGWTARLWPSRLALVWRLLLPVALLGGLPWLVQLPLRLLLIIQPDLTWTMLLTAALSLLTGLVYVVAAARPRSRAAAVRA